MDDVTVDSALSRLKELTTEAVADEGRDLELVLDDIAWVINDLKMLLEEPSAYVEEMEAKINGMLED